MKMRNINAYYYPTTIVLLDDNKKFLEKLGNILSKHYPLKIYDTTDLALEFLGKTYKSHSYLDHFISNEEDRNIDHLTQDINIRDIHKALYFASRFDEVSIFIVDYNMPGINGIEVSRLVRQKQPDIKIILLTGEADQALAIAAFNEGVIDKFIPKSSENLKEVLLESVHILQSKYFSHFSKILLNSAARLKELNSLNDTTYVNLFEKICVDHHIVEYYLMDNQGSFLLLDESGKPSWLAIKSDHEMDELYQYAEISGAPESIINALKSKQYLPYFHSEEDLQTSVEDWKEYFHPAQQLKGKDIYYYSYIEDPKAYDINPDKIISYKEYLQKK